MKPHVKAKKKKVKRVLPQNPNLRRKNKNGRSGPEGKKKGAKKSKNKKDGGPEGYASGVTQNKNLKAGECNWGEP